jgi:signal transduction histidine kinase
MTKRPKSDRSTYVRRLERLLEASRLLNSTLELTELTEIVLRIVTDEVPVDRCTLFVVDRQRKTLRSFIAQGVAQTEINLPFGQGLAGTVAATGQTLDIQDAYKDNRFQPRFDQELGYRTKDIFCMPILNCHGDSVGVLELLNRRRPLNQGDREFLSSMCTYIDLALQNAWIHHELQESRNLEHDLRLMSDRLARAEKLCELNELVSGIVHEMRNPLTIALGQCELLSDQHGEGSEIVTRTDKIKKSINQALKVAQNFLNFARPAGRDCTPTDVNALIRQTADLLAYDFRRHGITFALDLQPAPYVTIDPASFQQVLLNLLRNAQQVTVESGEHGRVSVRSSYDQENGLIRVEVSDNGPGIPAEAQSQIFDPFFTTKPRGSGTGLGLTVSRRIIEQHHGKLWFESRPRSGTTFVIELSVSAVSQPSGAPQAVTL